MNPADVVRLRQLGTELQKITSVSRYGLPEVMALYEIGYEIKKIGSDILVWSITEEKKLWKK